MKELIKIQSELNAPKNQKNKFGNYDYRSCEDILEGLKPLLKEANCYLTLSDEIIMVSDRIYVKATATITNSAINESISAFSGNANQTLSGANTCGFGTVSVASVEIYNTSNDYIITSGNYTVFTTGIISNDTNTANLAQFAWQVSYTYTDGGAACNATSVMVTQFGAYPALVGLIGTIIFLGIVIGVLVASFVFGKRSGI